MQYCGNLNYLEDFTKLLQIKRYSLKTIKTYKNALKIFIQAFPEKDIAGLSVKEIENFINHKVTVENCSVSYQKSLVGAIKFFFNQQLRKNYQLDYMYPDRREYKLPEVLSKSEMQSIISSISNLKHKSIISTIYACGLRLSEALNLRVKDIDSKRNLLRIEQSKGNKDRYVPLSENLLQLLREYYKSYKPKHFLFEGQNGERYSARSVQSILKNALKKAKIQKNVSVHSLRHSYASHLLESGVDIRIIQKLLGHRSIKTTQIYTHVSAPHIQSVKCPYDDIVLNAVPSVT
jgi:site-specific recombinase XerD